MTHCEIAKCVCGSERRVIPTMLGEFRVACSDCGWAVIQRTESEAVAAWNAVMRPRPVVTVTLEDTGWTHFSVPDVFSFIIGDESAGNEVAKLTAAGFDVKETE
jgi:hypothetical protein